MSDAPEDPYSRAEYRRLIAWKARIKREAPFLRRLLEEAPERSVLDVGCGSGEHVAFFAQEGARAVGLDRSEAMVEAAREHEVRGHGRFVLGDALEAQATLARENPFGLALCLGNMLPHVDEDEALEQLIARVTSRLLPGGLLLLQTLNYTRIQKNNVRHLPVNFREGDGGEEIVFLRLMKPVGGGRILFFPTTLSLDPESEEPVTVKSTRRVPLRAWTAEDLRPRLERAGMEVKVYGTMQGDPYDAEASHDLVMVAKKGS